MVLRLLALLVLALPCRAATLAEDFFRALAVGEEVCARLSVGDAAAAASFMAPEPSSTTFRALESEDKIAHCGVRSRKISEETRELVLGLLFEDGSPQEVTLKFSPLENWRFGYVSGLRIGKRGKAPKRKKSPAGYRTGFEGAHLIQAEMDGAPREVALRRIEAQIAAERKRLAAASED